MVRAKLLPARGPKAQRRLLDSEETKEVFRQGKRVGS